MCKIQGMSPQELIAEAEIRAALARGEEKSDALRDGKGNVVRDARCVIRDSSRVELTLKAQL